MKKQKMIHRIKPGLEKKSLFRFLVLLTSVLVIVITLIYSVVFIIVYRNSLHQTAILNSEQAVSQVANTIEIYSEEMKNDLKLLEKELERCQSRSEVNKYVNSMVQVQSNTVSIVVYDEQGNILECGTDGKMLKGTLAQDMSFLPELFKKGNYEISTPHIQNMFKSYYPWVATIGTPLRTDIYGRKVYVALDVKFFSILSYVDNVSIGQHGYCFVIDERGELVYHPQQQLLYAGLKEESLDMISKLTDGVQIKNDTIYSVKTLEDGHWKVVGVSYTDELIGDKLAGMLKTMWISVSVCIILSLIVIFVFIRKVTNPVKDLTDAMKEFEQNATEFKYHKVDGIYEVQLLSESFEHMVLRIQWLMEKVKKEEITLRKTELKALQTQINPHFLYNTLDSIQWMCEQGEMERAVLMVSALAKLFRISISKGQELIPIEKELQHAENYLVIQSFRYKNQFTYRFDVNPDILCCYCNKITLQPIIENAIIHGLDGLCDEGEIVVQAEEDGNDILFTVSDNGIGMTKEQCKKILEHDSSDNFGIGIKNVNDRIQIYFGKEYGLHIKSELDEGTAISIRLPKLTEEVYKNM